MNLGTLFESQMFHGSRKIHESLQGFLDSLKIHRVRPSVHHASSWRNDLPAFTGFHDCLASTKQLECHSLLRVIRDSNQSSLKIHMNGGFMKHNSITNNTSATVQPTFYHTNIILRSYIRMTEFSPAKLQSSTHTRSNLQTSYF